MAADNTSFQTDQNDVDKPPKYEDIPQSDKASVEKEPIKEESPKDTVEKQETEDVDKTDECMIMVGTTGTGKTTTLNIYTGNELPTGVSAQSITEMTVAVKDKNHPGGPKWIDTPGWSDTEGRSDQMLFKQLLRHLQGNKLYKVKAVVWCVMPTPRMDAILQAQAEFIDMFTMEDEKTVKVEAGQIWPNVVIVCKGKLDADLEDDVKGAMMAAKKKNVHAKPLAIRWEFATPEIIAGCSEQLRKDTLRMLTNEEIRGELEEVFSQLPACVQVVFATKKCVACGQEGDPRLMEDKCHRNIKKGHTGVLKQRFTKVQAGGSMGAGAVGTVALASAAAVSATPAVLIALPFVLGPGLIIGGHRLLNAPKDDPAPFGGIKITDMRWTCCDMPELAEGGCTDLCDHCDKPWGSSPPCVLIKHPDINMQKSLEGYEVHVKEHDLVDIAVEP